MFPSWESWGWSRFKSPNFCLPITALPRSESGIVLLWELAGRGVRSNLKRVNNRKRKMPLFPRFCFEIIICITLKRAETKNTWRISMVNLKLIIFQGFPYNTENELNFHPWKHLTEEIQTLHIIEWKRTWARHLLIFPAEGGEKKPFLRNIPWSLNFNICWATHFHNWESFVPLLSHPTSLSAFISTGGE